MSVEQLHRIIADPSTTPGQRTEAAKLILAAEKKNPTQDFVDFVLWYTWKYGTNNGQGDFDTWRKSEGVRLNQFNDERLLSEIEDQRNRHPDPWMNELMIRVLEGDLSWNYSVPAEDRHMDISFRIIE